MQISDILQDVFAFLTSPKTLSQCYRHTVQSPVGFKNITPTWTSEELIHTHKIGIITSICIFRLCDMLLCDETILDFFLSVFLINFFTWILLFGILLQRPNVV